MNQIQYNQDMLASQLKEYRSILNEKTIYIHNSFSEYFKNSPFIQIIASLTLCDDKVEILFQDLKLTLSLTSRIIIDDKYQPQVLFTVKCPELESDTILLMRMTWQGKVQLSDDEHRFPDQNIEFDYDTSSLPASIISRFLHILKENKVISI
ncbi:hypothetical protein I5385_04185 [Citrobacter freundii]|uniref:hypothetical protein n=1 Tax=Citrobacter freundii TaxID=546 RepID=UPI0039B60ABE|nr:hypothetical protein [Citrobacter freundii]